jgi:hypothetical protein
MNWEAIGAVGEILGAIGVIATLGYLAIQIRQSTKATKVANYNEAIHHMTAMMLHITKDEEISRIWPLGREGSGALSEEDKERFKNLMIAYFSHIQAEFLSFREGMCDRTACEAQARETADFLEFQGTASVWDTESSHLDELFVSYIEDRRERGPAKRLLAPDLS